MGNLAQSFQFDLIVLTDNNSFTHRLKEECLILICYLYQLIIDYLNIILRLFIEKINNITL